MEQRGMLRPTSCDLSPGTNVFKDNESNEDTEPRHCTNLLLWRVVFSTLILNSSALEMLEQIESLSPEMN